MPFRRHANVRDHFHVSCFADDTGLKWMLLQGRSWRLFGLHAGPQRNSDNNIDLLLRNLDTSLQPVSPVQNRDCSRERGRGSTSLKACWKATSCGRDRVTVASAMTLFFSR